MSGFASNLVPLRLERYLNIVEELCSVRGNSTRKNGSQNGLKEVILPFP
jgi:hypothetical protein